MKLSMIFAAAMLLLTASCAHQADLRTPSQIVEDKAKAKTKEANSAKRAVKRAERDAQRARDMAKNPSTTNKESEEVTVPESNQ